MCRFFDFEGQISRMSLDKGHIQDNEVSSLGDLRVSRSKRLEKLMSMFFDVSCTDSKSSTIVELQLS